MTNIFFTYGMVLWCILYFFLRQVPVVQNPLDNDSTMVSPKLIDWIGIC